MESLEDFLRMLIEYDVTLIGSLLSTINIDTDQDKVGGCMYCCVFVRSHASLRRDVIRRHRRFPLSPCFMHSRDSALLERE